MKTLKDFVSSLPVKQEPEVFVESVETAEPEILEVEELPLLIGEEVKNKQMDPPMVLMMKRKWVRQYPNGQRVALYYVDKINKYVTVPYTSAQWSSTTAEETK